MMYNIKTPKKETKNSRAASYRSSSSTGKSTQTVCVWAKTGPIGHRDDFSSSELSRMSVRPATAAALLNTCCAPSSPSKMLWWRGDGKWVVRKERIYRCMGRRDVHRSLLQSMVLCLHDEEVAEHELEEEPAVVHDVVLPSNRTQCDRIHISIVTTHWYQHCAYQEEDS